MNKFLNITSATNTDMRQYLTVGIKGTSRQFKVEIKTFFKFVHLCKTEFTI